MFDDVRRCAASCLLFSALLRLHPAGNIVVDGDFELADPASHSIATTYFDTTSPDIGDHVWFVTLGAVGVFTDFPVYNYAGNKSIYLPGGNDIPEGQLTQTLVTTPGQLYSIGFWANSDDPSNIFSVTFGGVTVAGAPTTIDSHLFPFPSNSDRFEFYSGTATATSISTDLTLFSYAPFGAVMIDNVSVTAIPEPSSLALAGIAVAVCFAARKHRHANGC